jgi:hypothetical protein
MTVASEYAVGVDDPVKGEVYLDEPWLSIWWDPACSCVHGEWKAFATSVEFRAGLMKGLDAIKHKKAAGYVSDTRKVKVIVHKDQQWVQETWIPLAVAAGLKRLALVTGNPGLGKTTVVELVDQVDDDTFLRSFETVDDAFKWVATA